MTIPKHIRATIDNIFKAEGGYNPHDRDNLPCLKGITAAVWADWVNHHPTLSHGTKLNKEQAADDIRAIAGKGGKSYTGLSMSSFADQAAEITYNNYFLGAGLDHINSPKIQQYALEISYHRGPGSLAWALNYAAGVEPRHADPLLDNHIPRSAERSHAIAYANGFLATGNNKTLGAEHGAVDPTAEQRFYARLRVAKLMEESHFVADRESGERALGLFVRAFEFPWATGNKHNPGLSSDPRDKYFNAAYQHFDSIYSAYQTGIAHHIPNARATFNAAATQFSDNLLHDPTSPLNQPATSIASITQPRKLHPAPQAPQAPSKVVEPVHNRTPKPVPDTIIRVAETARPHNAPAEHTQASARTVAAQYRHNSIAIDTDNGIVQIALNHGEFDHVIGTLPKGVHLTKPSLNFYVNGTMQAQQHPHAEVEWNGKRITVTPELVASLQAANNGLIIDKTDNHLDPAKSVPIGFEVAEHHGPVKAPPATPVNDSLFSMAPSGRGTS